MRLGLHRMTGSQDALFREYVAAVRPPWVKMLEEWPRELVEFCHQQGTKVIGRVYFPVDQQTEAGFPRAREKVVEAARNHPWVDAWELYNECFQKPEHAVTYAGISIRFAEQMILMGKIAVLGCFSTGQPEMDYWAGYLPALKMIERSRGRVILGLHEYGGDDMFKGREGQLGWWALRYRRHRLAWNALGLGEIPVLITESGKDNILPDGKGGFRDRPGEYAVEMADYCRELTKDSYIKGIVDFGWATADPAWETFDVSNNPDLVRRLMSLMTMLPIGPAVPQEPVTMPPIQKVTPRVYSSRAGYRPRYVVLHSAAGGPGLTAHSLALYLSKNSAGASAHYSVGPGEIFAIVDEGDAAHHAGGSTLPDGTRGTYKNGTGWVDAVNAVSIGVEMVQEAGQPTPNEVVSYAAMLVADICRRWGIPASRVVGHREISGPGGHVDPVGVEMDAFRRGIASMLGSPTAPPPVVGVSEALKAEARKRAILAVNPQAALYKAITASGMVPVSAEFDAEPRLVAQVADGPRGRHLFFVTVGDWSNVKQIKL